MASLNRILARYSDSSRSGGGMSHGLRSIARPVAEVEAVRFLHPLHRFEISIQRCPKTLRAVLQALANGMPDWASS